MNCGLFCGVGKKSSLSEFSSTFSSPDTNKVLHDHDPQRLTTEQQKEKQKLDEKTRTFSILPSQWDIHQNQEWLAAIFILPEN
jgi:hypothetical protein